VSEPTTSLPLGRVAGQPPPRTQLGTRGAIRHAWLKPIGVLGAMACLAWAVLDGQFRDAEGFPSGEIVVPIAVGLALLVVTWAATSTWAGASRWLAVALVGQAVALQIIDAGQLIHYQHYRLTAASLVWLVLFSIQAALVIVGLRQRWRQLASWFVKTLPGWRLPATGLAVLVSAAALSREPVAYATEVPFATLVELVNLGTIVLLAAALPSDALPTVQGWIDRLLGPPVPDGVTASRGLDRFAWLAAAWVTAVSAVLAAFIYERHPHVPDEVIYLYPARYFAHGMLTMPAPPVPTAFEVYLMDVVNGRWFSPVQPGWPALLAIGELANLAWLIDPILAGVNILLGYLLLRAFYDRRTTRLVTLLLCTSPWFLFMGMNFMTHMSTLACALAPAVMLVYARRTAHVRWALLAGALVGYGALIRQLDGLLVGAVLGLWLIGSVLPDFRRGERRMEQLRLVVGFGLAAGLVSALWLPINLYLTGSPTAFPLEAYLDRTFGPGRNALGFGPNRGFGWQLQPLPGHTPLNAALNDLLNLFSVNIELLGWATGSICILAALVFSGRLRRREWLAVASIVVVVGTYSLYWYSGGPDFGARYWFVVIVPFAVLIARALLELDREFPARALAAGLVLCGIAVVVYIPWRSFDKYHHYLHMRPDLPALAEAHSFGRSLVMVRGEEQPDYASAIIYNPLDLQADAPVYVHERGPQIDAAIIQALQDRPVWIVDGPTLTNAGYRIAFGPLNGPDALRQLDSP
jgi:hypothetical protein